MRRLATVAVVGCALWAAAPASADDPTVVAAGNIACDSKSPYFNAGTGTATRCHQAATGKLLGGASAVLALGDIQYCCATLPAFQASFDTAWGAAKAVTRPVPGTREYVTSRAGGYFDYFNGPGAQTGAAGPTGLGYYSFDLGGWHLIALNTNCTHVACAKDSAQERWLRADLAAHPASCTLAFGHAPRFSSGKPGGSLQAKPLWQALYEAGAEMFLSAYARHYERFAPQKPAGALDGTYGIRQFVVGTGGYGLGPLNAPKPRSEVRQNTAFGVLELTLRPTGYDWRFVPEAGATFTDTGSSGCHAAPPPPRGEHKPPSQKKSDKRGCTITGTPRNDVLLGTRRRDVICGLGGRDRIAGGKGNDVIHGDGGADVLKGGDGGDRVSGGGGNDRLAGGRGRDRLSGDGGDDVLRGHRGRDRLEGGRGRDRLFGNAGPDSLDDGADRSKDQVRGGRGRDRAWVGANDAVAAVERVNRRQPARVPPPEKPIVLSEEHNRS